MLMNSAESFQYMSGARPLRKTLNKRRNGKNISLILGRRILF